jgi:hypothetical protein
VRTISVNGAAATPVPNAIAFTVVGGSAPLKVNFVMFVPAMALAPKFELPPVKEAGNVNSVKAAQPLKALSPIMVRVFGNSISSSRTQPAKALVWIVVMAVGRVTLVKAAQPLKALSPIVVIEEFVKSIVVSLIQFTNTLAGKIVNPAAEFHSTSIRFAQLAKALAPIVVSETGRVTFCKFEAAKNAVPFIVVKVEDVISNSLIHRHSLKAASATPVIPSPITTLYVYPAVTKSCSKTSARAVSHPPPVPNTGVVSPSISLAVSSSIWTFVLPAECVNVNVLSGWA